MPQYVPCILMHRYDNNITNTKQLNDWNVKQQWNGKTKTATENRGLNGIFAVLFKSTACPSHGNYSIELDFIEIKPNFVSESKLKVYNVRRLLRKIN